MYPEHLIDMAEEVFEAYFQRDPLAQHMYDELRAAVKQHLETAGTDVPVQTYLDGLCSSVA